MHHSRYRAAQYRSYRRVGYPAREAYRIACADERYHHLEDVECVIVDDDDPDLSWIEDDKERARQYELGIVGVRLVRLCPEHGIDCRHAQELGSLWGITLSGDIFVDTAYLHSVRADLMHEAGL